jgi:hypothetical protein
MIEETGHQKRVLMTKMCKISDYWSPKEGVDDQNV